MIATGQQIRAARAALGWSREALAEHAGISPGIVAYWERTDTPRRHTRARAPGRIAAVLRSAGVEMVSEPRIGVLLDVRGAS